MLDTYNIGYAFLRRQNSIAFHRIYPPIGDILFGLLCDSDLDETAHHNEAICQWAHEKLVVFLPRWEPENIITFLRHMDIFVLDA
jgi:hypothetical protein